MVARKSNGLIVLLAFNTIFHELGVSQSNFHTDKHGRCWKKIIDPESQLICFSCKTNEIFLKSPDLEQQVQYI